MDSTENCLNSKEISEVAGLIFKEFCKNALSSLNLYFSGLQMKHAVALCFLLLLCGCQDNSQPEANRPQLDPSKQYQAVVTTGMVGDLVRHVAAEHAEVIGLMGEGVDPHLFRPTAADNGKMMNADIIIYSGLMLEGPLQPALEQASKRGKTVASVTENLPQNTVRFPDGFGHHPDPHVWGDIKTWTLCLDQVVDVLSKFDPDHAEDYKKNAAVYRDELQEIDSYARKAIASIPEDRRYLVTAHDAFEYFASAYKIQVKSVQGISTESDPGVQDINELVDFLVENKIPAIFVEATVNSANLQAVIEGAKQQDWEVIIGGMLYSDSLGTPGTYEGTYIGMMDSNITTITRALGGTVPQKGLHGKLRIR